MKSQKHYERWFAFLRWLVTPFVCRKFNYSYDSLEQVNGPYLLLCNHNVNWDPIFVGIAAKKQIFFVATENILRNKLAARFLMYVFHPIIHMKGRNGARSSMEILKTLKHGQNVALFAEGNRSFDGVTGEISFATAKLARRSGAALVTYRIEGGYLTQPRWSTTMRRGKLTGRLVRMYPAEELQNMSDQQVYDAIREDLHEDAWETQRRSPVEYHGKHLAYGLESTLYACPECLRFNTMKSDDNGIFCSCGQHSEMNEYGYLKQNSGRNRTISDWNAFQKKLLADRVKENPAGELFSDLIRVGTVNGHEITDTRCAELRGFSSGFELEGKKIPFNEVAGTAIFSRNVLTIHLTDGTQYEICGDVSFNALKYYDLYRICTERAAV